MTELAGLEAGCTYSLQLGASWDALPTKVVHAVQYDFKPASIDPSQPGQMKIDDNNGVMVTLPHRDIDEASEFKGHKKPVSKECFLVVNHKTKTVTLEKISNTIRLKRSRTAKKNRPSLVRREDERVSPVPSQLSSQATISPQQPPAPSVPKQTPSVELPKNIKPEIKHTASPKKLKTVAMPTSGTLSSESSGSDSNSSDDSSSSDTEPNFVKSEPSDLFKPSEMFDEVFSKSSTNEVPSSSENLKRETPNDSELNPLDMLSQDLDLSDSDDSD